MSIHKIGSDLVRPLAPKAGERIERKEDGSPQGGAASRTRSDQVGLSPQGLAMAELARSDRLEAIQVRIDNGFYDDPQIAEEVAHRLIESGDLHTLT